MYLIRGIQNIDLFLSKHKDTELIATIGNFDGLHLGHQHIIENMQKDSEVNGWQKLVIFTEPHAREFLLSLFELTKKNLLESFLGHKK